ncbi:MAG: sugar transferase [Lachnospiraceae bacterium]|nr:sugar transferase [Lachnospiraceae bacterium]
MYERFIKRLIDLILSAGGIIVAAVPMLIVAVLIKADSPGPVFFRQKRVGIHKSHFMIIKFRSMPVSAPKDTPTHELKNAASLLSPFQEAIRKYSIDELPQLFNIFAGQMSFVGPRPALWNQYDLLEERDKYGANDVKPGLTGWAQINGRDELPIAVKAAYDGEYVRNLSFSFDVKCFLRTFFKVAKAEGVSEGGQKAPSGGDDKNPSGEDDKNV